MTVNNLEYMLDSMVGQLRSYRVLDQEIYGIIQMSGACKKDCDFEQHKFISRLYELTDKRFYKCKNIIAKARGEKRGVTSRMVIMEDRISDLESQLEFGIWDLMNGSGRVSFMDSYDSFLEVVKDTVHPLDNLYIIVHLFSSDRTWECDDTHIIPLKEGIRSMLSTGSLDGSMIDDRPF